MLTICRDALPQSCLCYVAFRLSFRDTLERIALWRQFHSGSEADDGPASGYLCEVPFFDAVPAHVQLDVLGETWSKHVCPEPVPATLVDESVIYAVCETAARIIEEEPASLARYLCDGPLKVDLTPDASLAAELRSLHLNLANEGDFLLIGQFLDMPPLEARRLKRQFDLDEAELATMFETLGRWSLSPGFFRNLTYLLTPAEIARAAAVLGVKCAT